jgi:hypothetical protein
VPASPRKSRSFRPSRLRRQKPGGILPSGELRRCRASVPGEPLSFGTIADQAAQRLRQRGHIVRRYQQAGARRYRVGIAPVLVDTTGSPCAIASASAIGGALAKIRPECVQSVPLWLNRLLGLWRSRARAYARVDGRPRPTKGAWVDSYPLNYLPTLALVGEAGARRKR